MSSTLFRYAAIGISLALPLCQLACQSDDPVKPPPSQMRFFDSDNFEGEFRASLAHGHDQVTVVFAGKDATLNNLPDRMDKWLTAVKGKFGNRVDVEPDPSIQAVRGKGIGIGTVLSLGMSAYAAITQHVYYLPASDYNALVLFHPDDASLTRIVFIRKPDA